MSQSNIGYDYEEQEEEMERAESGEEEMEGEETEELYQAMKYVMMIIEAVMQVLNEFLIIRQSARIERPLTRRPITSDGYDYIQKVLKEDTENFRKVYRMYPDVFLKLCRIIREKTPLKETRFICVEEMLATFLMTVGQNVRYCLTSKTFSRSRFATSRNFHKVLKALNTIAPEMMAKPPLSTVASKIRESTRFDSYFKDCIGDVDGTHIPAMVRGRELSSYRNRHATISQNVLAACNFDLEFIYVLSGWEGSAHDSKVLDDAVTRRNGLVVPQGKYFLVDCGFANRRQFLAPFRGVRYHLQDFAGQGCDPENAAELFNLRHASLRNVIERIFGIFKSRFTIFKTAPPFSYTVQAELVLACAGLHNFLRKECRSDEFPVEVDNECSSTSTFAHTEEDFFESAFQTQEQQRQSANNWRHGIASDMWGDISGHVDNAEYDN